MPRRKRCILPEVPCYINQRGVDRRQVVTEDREPAHLFEADRGEPPSRWCKDSGLLLDGQSCPPRRGAGTGRLVEHSTSTGSWAVRASRNWGTGTPRRISDLLLIR